jgi:Trk K+ transport system NAD-binding subunit
LQDFVTSEFQVSTSGFDLDLFSIDSIISPSKLVTDFIKNIIEHPGAFQAFDFADGKLQVIGATCPKRWTAGWEKII